MKQNRSVDKELTSTTKQAQWTFQDTLKAIFWKKFNCIKFTYMNEGTKYNFLASLAFEKNLSF